MLGPFATTNVVREPYQAFSGSRYPSISPGNGRRALAHPGPTGGRRDPDQGQRGWGSRDLGLRGRPHRSEDPFAPMFDFAWSEIALIAGVALVVIGPKDLPVALRAISGFVKKARRMAGEFQTHVDEMMRDADLKDVKDSFNQIRNFDFRGTVEKAIDPDHSLRNTFAGNPLEPSTTSTGTVGPASSPTATSWSAKPLPDEHLPEPEPPPPVRVAAPPFIPPALVPFVDGPKAAASRRRLSFHRPPCSNARRR